MSKPYEFHCTYCGREFGEDVIELAKHIGATHDPSRTNFEVESN